MIAQRLPRLAVFQAAPSPAAVIEVSAAATPRSGLWTVDSFSLHDGLMMQLLPRAGVNCPERVCSPNWPIG